LIKSQLLKSIRYVYNSKGDLYKSLSALLFVWMLTLNALLCKPTLYSK